MVTSLELEHVDKYSTVEELYQAFGQLCASVQQGGHIVLCADDPGCRELFRRGLASGDDISWGWAARQR